MCNKSHTAAGEEKSSAGPELEYIYWKSFNNFKYTNSRRIFMHKMKFKAAVLILLLAFAAPQRADAQMIIAAPILEGLITASRTENVIFYTQAIIEMAQSAINTYQQLQFAIRTYEQALRNMRNIREVTSFSDFMDWYNRQLFLERQTEARFRNMGVTVGGRRYSMTEIMDIPRDVNRSFSDVYAYGLTDAQRRNMWINLGLTPANYVYIRTWEAKQRDLAMGVLTRRQLRDEEAMQAAMREHEIAQDINMDQFRSDADRMSEKTLLGLIAEVLMGTNRAIRDMHRDQLEAAELELVNRQLENTPPNRSVLHGWNRPMFSSITEEEGEFINLF